MSVVFRKTVAALSFSEAAANVILTSSGHHPDVVQSAKLIKTYCNDAYKSIDGVLREKDILKFKRAAQKADILWKTGDVVDGQSMVSWCNFIMDEPRQMTKNMPLKSALQSIADLWMHVLGFLEDRDGGPRWEPIDEANATYRKWREAGWI